MKTINRAALIGGVCILLLVGFELIQGRPDGAALFRSQGCIGCHSFKGKGGELCPDLTAVTSRRSDSWIRDQIENPKKHNPNSMMPSFNNLSRREVSALIAYFKS